MSSLFVCVFRVANPLPCPACLASRGSAVASLGMCLFSPAWFPGVAPRRRGSLFGACEGQAGGRRSWPSTAPGHPRRLMGALSSSGPEPFPETFGRVPWRTLSNCRLRWGDSQRKKSSQSRFEKVFLVIGRNAGFLGALLLLPSKGAGWGLNRGSSPGKVRLVSLGTDSIRIRWSGVWIPPPFIAKGNQFVPCMKMSRGNSTCKCKS